MRIVIDIYAGVGFLGVLGIIAISTFGGSVHVSLRRPRLRHHQEVPHD